MLTSEYPSVLFDPQMILGRTTVGRTREFTLALYLPFSNMLKFNLLLKQDSSPDMTEVVKLGVKLTVTLETGDVWYY